MRKLTDVMAFVKMFFSGGRCTGRVERGGAGVVCLGGCGVWGRGGCFFGGDGMRRTCRAAVLRCLVDVLMSAFYQEKMMAYLWRK